MAEKDFREYAAGRIRDMAKDRANQLRRMADDIERAAGLDYRGDIHSLVSTTIHTVSWGFANLRLDSMVTWLGRMDKAETKENETA